MLGPVETLPRVPHRCFDVSALAASHGGGVQILAAIDLSGKRIAVVLENKFIQDEIEAYLKGFALLGAEVELVSRIWYGD